MVYISSRLNQVSGRNNFHDQFHRDKTVRCFYTYHRNMYIIQTLEVLALLFQRQPVADVLQNRCKTCNFVKRILQNRRFLVNLAKFLRTALFIEQPCWLLLLFLCFAPGSALAFVSYLNKLFQQRMVPPIYHCFVFKILNYMFSSIYNDT